MWFVDNSTAPTGVEICIFAIIDKSSNTATIIATATGILVGIRRNIESTTLCSGERKRCCLACWVNCRNLGNQCLSKVNKLTKSTDFLLFLSIGYLVQLCTTCCVKSAILNIVVLATVGHLNLEQVCTSLEWVGSSTLANLKVCNVHTLGNSVRYHAEVGHILCNLQACRCCACYACACCSSRCRSKWSCSYYKLGI